jgi:hypothetical protein
MNEARSVCLANPPDHNRHLPSMRNRSTAALLDRRRLLNRTGPGGRGARCVWRRGAGTQVALQATARLSFVLFWPAYSAAALAALFGPSFQPLRRRVREFGLAFAAAHLVHLELSPGSATSAMRRRGALSFSSASPLCARICLRCSRSLACSGRSGQRLVAAADRRP